MLMRELHRLYLLPGLVKLPSTYTSMDSSRPWFLYWTVHALDLLEKLPTDPALRERLAGEYVRMFAGGNLLKQQRH